MHILRSMTVLAALTLALGAGAAAAQTMEEDVAAGKWGHEVSLGANLLQSAYSKNWKSGDKGSIVWNATLDAKAQKQLSESWNMWNVLNLAFGQNHQQDRDDDGALYWKKPDKTTDQIKAESLLRYTKSELDPFVSVRFESQFLDQSDPRGDFSLNPLEFFETVGISRMFVENEQRRFLMRAGFTFHQMSRELYLDPVWGDDPVTESASDAGIEVVFNYGDKKLLERVSYTGQLRFYKPVHYSAKGDLEDLGSDELEAEGLPGDLAEYTTALDIDFDNTFKTQITSVINVQLSVRWVYDKYDNTVKPVVIEDAIHNASSVEGAIRKAGQFKQTLSLGVAYTF